jgi:hypothetical protein
MHPPKEYHYFENAAANPFHADAKAFSFVNAWWLAESAMLVYEDQQKVEQILGALEFTVKCIGKWDPVAAAGGATKHQGEQCFLAYKENFAIVSFRGTQSDNVDSLRDDIIIWPVQPEQCRPEAMAENLKEVRKNCLVHKGFDDALQRLWPDLSRELVKLVPARPVFFTGHSLGAALATIAMLEYLGSSFLYTFGSPRVGNQAFRTELGDSAIYRFVNCEDFVTCVPPECNFYTHVGTEMYFDHQGHLHLSPGLGFKTADAATGQMRHFTSSMAAPPFFIGNHSPGRYAVLTWNAYLEKSPAAAKGAAV